MQNITTLVIDNRPGAGGALGSDLVAKAAPDGYTMLHTSSSHASLPVIMKSLPYDPVKDFTPITLIVNSAGFLLVAQNGITARTIPEFIALAKSQPGKITYGSGGIGNVMHFAAELFNDKAGTQLMHIPYKGVGQAIIDLAAGRVDVCFGPATALLPQIKAGRIKALGITAPARWSGLPEVPTIDEAGVKGYSFVPWYGLWFPARTPDGLRESHPRRSCRQRMQDPEIRNAMGEQGFVPAGIDAGGIRENHRRRNPDQPPARGQDRPSAGIAWRQRPSASRRLFAFTESVNQCLNHLKASESSSSAISSPARFAACCSATWAPTSSRSSARRAATRRARCRRWSTAKARASPR